MKPNGALRVVESNDLGQSSEFGISFKDSAHIMSILREQIYSDKVLAVLREYSANAWDSHRQSGKPDVPIKVQLPTSMEPTLCIRDFGKGLSRQDVFEVYTQYGASSKRNDDNAVGMLGIGCKSGFAYSDSFTIVSFFEGKRSTYVAVLDKSEKGNITLLEEGPCGDETGIEIQIAVRPNDIMEFERKAKELFQYFNPRPDINAEIPALPTGPSKVPLEHGFIAGAHDYYSEGKWVAVMGCIPYRINLDQLRDNYGNTQVAEFVRRISGALFFEIGEVQISASREELKYSDATKQVLTEKFQFLIDEFVQKTLEALDASGLTTWEKRLKAQIFSRLHIPMDKLSCKDLVANYVPFKANVQADEGTTQDLTLAEFKKQEEKVPRLRVITFSDRKISQASGVSVQSTTRLVLRDDRRALAGFGLRQTDYIVSCPMNADMNLLLADMIDEMDIEGIPMIAISTLDWTPANCEARGFNIKHKVRQFKLNGTSEKCLASDNWEAVDRNPEPEDVFCIISRFESCDGTDIFRNRRQDRRICEALKLDPNTDLPPIYAYKDILSKPVKKEACKGTHYTDWRRAWTKGLLTDDVKEVLAAFAWKKNFRDRYWNWDDAQMRRAAKLSESLGEDHPIVQMLTKYKAALDRVKGIEEGPFQELVSLSGEKLELEPEKVVAALVAEYPLFSCDGITFDLLWSKEQHERWIEYVQMVDNLKTKENTDAESPAVHTDE